MNVRGEVYEAIQSENRRKSRSAVLTVAGMVAFVTLAITLAWWLDHLGVITFE